jgi:methyl-accepting chemotaxis protein
MTRLRGETLKRVTWIRRMLAFAAVMVSCDTIVLMLKSRDSALPVAAIETSIELEQRLHTVLRPDLNSSNSPNSSVVIARIDDLDQDLRAAFNPTQADSATAELSEILTLWSQLYGELQDRPPSDATALASFQPQLDAIIALIATQRSQQLQAIANRNSNYARTTITLALLSLIATAIAYTLLERWLGSLQQEVTMSRHRIDSVGESIQQQRRVVSNQATSVAEITQMLDKLNGTSQASSEQASIAASRSKEIADLTGSGVELVTQTQAAIVGIETQTTAISKHIWQLRTRATEVGQIALLVEELAMRTNTLALNAAIEAVRASRSGAGFQVIAKEIRELSVQSQQAARRIGAMSDDIERAIEETVSVTQAGLEQAEAGTRIVQSTTETFHQIQQAIEEVNDTSHRMAFSAYELLWPLQQVMEAMEALNSNARSTETNSDRLADGLEELEMSFKRIQLGMGERSPQPATDQNSPKTAF